MDCLESQSNQCAVPKNICCQLPCRLILWWGFHQWYVENRPLEQGTGWTRNFGIFPSFEKSSERTQKFLDQIACWNRTTTDVHANENYVLKNLFLELRDR